MSSKAFRLGIQSYCFREFKTLDQLIAALKTVALEYVEIWPGHIDPDQPAETLQAALDSFAAAGISMDSLGLAVFRDDMSEARKAMDFCRMAGVKAVSADIAPNDEAIAQADAIAAEYDILLAVHNHGHKHHWGSVEQLDRLFEMTSPRVGLCLDTAWMLDSGEDPLAVARRYKDRLYGVHLKDFEFRGPERKPVDVIVGTGGLDLPGLMDFLREINFDGYMSLEYEGNPADPMDEVLACLSAIRDNL